MWGTTSWVLLLKAVGTYLMSTCILQTRHPGHTPDYKKSAWSYMEKFLHKEFWQRFAYNFTPLKNRYGSVQSSNLL